MKDDERAERLAAALRANLRRRKAHARGLGPAPEGEGAPGDDTGDPADEESEQRRPD